MFAFGCLLAATFGVELFFIGYYWCRYERALSSGDAQRRKLRRGMGSWADLEPADYRKAKAFLTFVTLGAAILLGMACGLDVLSWLIWIGVGAGVGFGYHEFVIRPFEKMWAKREEEQERQMAEYRKEMEERQSAAEDVPLAENQDLASDAPAQPSDCGGACGTDPRAGNDAPAQDKPKS